jgi:predicted nuclease with TOPRIM domain
MISQNFVSEKKDELGIETVTVIRDFEGVGSEEFYRNKNGTKYDKMPVNEFLSENRADNEQSDEPKVELQAKEEIKANEILRKLAKGYSFESVLKNVKKSPSEFKQRFDELIDEIRQLENSNPRFSSIVVKDFQVLYRED